MPSNEQRRRAAKRKLERQLARRAERAKRRRLIGIAVALVVVLLVGVGIWYLASRSSAPAAAPKCDYPASGTAAKPVQAPSTENVSTTGKVNVTLTTSAGDIPLTLDAAQAPCAVNSFVSLVKQGYYDDTPCPRLSTVGLQMLQCGDPTGTGSGGPGYKFNDEVRPDLTYGRGDLVMANAGPNTNGSQFFLVYGTADLPPSFTVFGKIADSGLKVLDTIAKAGDDESLKNTVGGGKPNTKVTITKAAVAG